MTLTGTQQDVFNALWDLLTACLPADVSVIKGQDNRVAPPKGLDYAVMTYLGQTRLSTDQVEYRDPYPAPGSYLFKQPIEARVQVDLHGPRAADHVVIITTLFRSAYGCEVLRRSGVQPLSTSEPTQLAFINEASQFEDRWSVDLMLQITQTVTVPVVDGYAAAIIIRPTAVQ